MGSDSQKCGHGWKTRTTTTISATSIILRNRMLFRLQRATRFIKVSHFFTLSSLNRHCSSTRFLQEPHKLNKVRTDASSIHVSGITESVLGKCSDLLLEPTHLSTTNISSLEELLVSVSSLNPRITRKFWRKCQLEPQDVLELLLGFESNVGKSGLDVKKIESLLGIFKWANISIKQVGNFKHLDQCFKIMVGLLVRFMLFEDAECLLLDMDKEGILLDNHEIYSNLIEWNVSLGNLEKSINLYDRMRGLNLVPSLSCYHNLVSYLVHSNQPELIFRVYDDMLETGESENDVNENVIQVLCRVGKIQESRNLIKKAFFHGIKPTSLILDTIVSGYCEKKDYDDLLSLFAETKSLPDVAVGNKIIHSMCQDFGVEKAFVFLNELEHLGFTPDAITFGILIGWNCREGNLKQALICLSNVLARGLKPHIYSYNAIISAVFKQGMWIHAKNIVLEMDDEGLKLDLSTFRVLLAGYCKAKQFDEVKVIIRKMVRNGLIELLPLQDPISRAFVLLGVDPLGVRVRRGNDVAFSRTEFYDSMGNGLYLEGDVVKYDQILTRVLDDSMIPDYNRLIMIDDNLIAVEELIHWGQKLSVDAFSTLLKKFHVSNYGFKAITFLLEKFPYLHHDLDEETLNSLLQAQVKRGFVHEARRTYDKMVKRNLEIKNETYSALVKGLSKKGDSKDLRDCWELARTRKWVPTLNDYRTLIRSLSQNHMLIESLSLFELAMADYLHEVLDLFYSFLENLCEVGYTKVAQVLFEELLNLGYDLDRVGYNHLLRGFCKENRLTQAFVLSNTILENNTSTNLDTYNVLLHGYCVAKDSRKVEEVLCAIISKNVPIFVSSYSKLVSLMCNEGRFHFALSIKDLMVKQSSSHLTVYNILIFHLFRSGNIILVDTLLDEIQENRLEFDDVTYKFLVYGFSKCNMVLRSLEYLNLMMSKELKPGARCLRAVISKLSSDGEFDKIVNLSQEMETRGWVLCSTVQNEVVMGLLKLGELEKAMNFLDRMNGSDRVPDNINYDNLIKQMCHYGQKGKALDLLDTMLKKENTPDSTSYDCLIQDLCVSDDVEDALDLYAEMSIRRLEPSVKTHEIVTRKLCETGRTSEAEKIIDTMICEGRCPSEVMFGSVISRYRSERNFRKASEVLGRMQRFGYKPDFETHWSLISTLSRFSGKDEDDKSGNFLSNLLSKSGFNLKKGVDPKSK